MDFEAIAARTVVVGVGGCEHGDQGGCRQGLDAAGFGELCSLLDQRVDEGASVPVIAVAAQAVGSESVYGHQENVGKAGWRILCLCSSCKARNKEGAEDPESRESIGAIHGGLKGVQWAEIAFRWVHLLCEGLTVKTEDERFILLSDAVVAPPLRIMKLQDTSSG